MKRYKNPLRFRVHHDGRQASLFTDVVLVIRGTFVGTVADVPCFTEVRMVDGFDRRRARDITTATYRGPVTIDVITADGQIVNRIAVADRCDVVQHPRGQVVRA